MQRALNSVWCRVSTQSLVAPDTAASVVNLSDIFDLNRVLGHGATGKIRALQNRVIMRME